MSEILRDDALRLVRAAIDYIAECERREVPCEESAVLREAISDVLRSAYGA